MSLKTFIEKVGGKIAHLFQSVFTSLEHAYEKLAPEVQIALKDGAGVVAFINANAFELPTVLKGLLLQAFPHLTEKEIDDALLVAATDINLLQNIVQPTGLQALEAIQNHLKSLSGSNWAKASDTLAKAIAIFRAPAGTKASLIFSFIVFVYQTFIKKP